MNIDEINGHAILLMAPTGSGKGSLVRHVRNVFPEMYFPVSCTTRKPRPGEEAGVDYHYIDRETFERKIHNNELLEWAEFGGNLYGTLCTEIITPLTEKKVLLNEIELQGVRQLMELIPEEHRTIVYVEAGDWDSLRARALARAPIDETELQLRHERYLEEIKMKPYATIVIENQDGQLETAQKALVEVIEDIYKTLA